MQKKCVKNLRTALPLFLVAATAIFAGCASTEPLAPQSSLSRVKAIAMAQQTAEAMGGRVFTIAPTGSMKPTLDENSVVAIEVVKFDELKQGDIVIYRDNSGLPIVHRLLQPGVGRWIVQGDNNSSADRESVTASNLIGRVCAIFYTSPGTQTMGQSALANR